VNLRRFRPPKTTADDLGLDGEGGRRPSGGGGDALNEGAEYERPRRKSIQRPDDDDARGRGGRQGRSLHLADRAGVVGLAVMGEDVKGRGGEKKDRDERRHPAFHAVTITRKSRVRQ
jgi:hypothetical protein